MTQHAQFSSDSDIHYPDSDGLPMSDNTLQFRWNTLPKLRRSIVSSCVLHALRSWRGLTRSGSLLMWPLADGRFSLVQEATALVYC